MAREAAAGRLRIAPRQVFSGGEPLLSEIRPAIADHWPVPLFNGWGSTEACSFTQPCERGFTHLAADLTILEPVDAAANPVPREIDLTHLQATLRTDLIAAGLPEPEVRVEAVETLERLAYTGKLRRFVPLVVRS